MGWGAVLGVGGWLAAGVGVAIVDLGDGAGELAAVGPAAPQAVTNTANAAMQPNLLIQEA
jgi:hypothetical protein